MNEDPTDLMYSHPPWMQPLVSIPTIGGSRDRGVWHTNFGINYGSISFGQLSGYIVFCILLIGGASPPV